MARSSRIGPPAVRVSDLVALRISGERRCLRQGLGRAESHGRHRARSKFWMPVPRSSPRSQGWRHGARVARHAVDRDRLASPAGIWRRSSKWAYGHASQCAEGFAEVSQHCRSGRRPHSIIRRHLSSAAVPSNCPHVLVRILRGPERENYSATYHDAQKAIDTQTPATFEPASEPICCSSATARNSANAPIPNAGLSRSREAARTSTSRDGGPADLG